MTEATINEGDRSADKQVSLFVSYSHDSQQHMDHVLELSNRLRFDGVDCVIDQYETSPAQGWARWCEDQLEHADFVLVVCTEEYRNRFRARSESGKGLGVKWEGAVINQNIYDAETNNTKFMPVIFSSEDVAYIPTILRGATHYDLATEQGYERLYRHITNQPAVLKPQLGKRKALSPLQRNINFPGLKNDSQTESTKSEFEQPRLDKIAPSLSKTDSFGRARSLLVVAVQVVVFIFAAFGGFLKGVAPPAQTNPKFTIGLGSFLVLIVLLLVSAMSRNANPDKSHRKWIVSAVIFFIVAIVAGLFYPRMLDKFTYPYPPPPDEPIAQHINGLELTESAKSFIRDNPDKSSPGELELNLPYEHIWTADSLSKAKLLLTANYLVLVLALASAIFCLLEVNVMRRRHPAAEDRT